MQAVLLVFINIAFVAASTAPPLQLLRQENVMTIYQQVQNSPAKCKEKAPVEFTLLL